MLDLSSSNQTVDM